MRPDDRSAVRDDGMMDDELLPLMVVAEEDAAAAAAGAVDDVPMLDARLAIASNCSISAVIEWGDNCEWPIRFQYCCC